MRSSSSRDGQRGDSDEEVPSVPQHHRGSWTLRPATADGSKKAVLCGGVLLMLLLVWRLALSEGGVAKDGVARVPGGASAPSVGRPSRATAESKSTATSSAERAPSFPLSSLRNGSVTTMAAPLEPTPVPEVIFDVRDRSTHEKFPGRRRCRIHPQCNASTCHTDPDLVFRGVVKSVREVPGAVCQIRWRPNASTETVRHIVAEFIIAYPLTHKPSWWRQSANTYVPGQVVHLFDATWLHETPVLPPPPEIGDILDFDAKRISAWYIYNGLFGKQSLAPVEKYPFTNATQGYYVVGTHPINPPRPPRRRCNCVGCQLDEPFRLKAMLFYHSRCKPAAVEALRHRHVASLEHATSRCNLIDTLKASVRSTRHSSTERLTTLSAH